MSRKLYRNKQGRIVVRTKKPKQKAPNDRRDRSATIIRKDGSLVKNNYQQILKQVRKSGYIALISDLRVEIENWRYEHRGEKLTERNLISRLTYNKIEKNFINAGLSADEAAAQAGVSTKELLDKDNWKGSEFMGKWLFQFNYSGSVWRKI